MPSQWNEGLVAICAAFTALCSIAVGLRFYARKRQRLSILVDDWMALLALLSFIAAAICVLISVHKKFLGYSINGDPQLLAGYQSEQSYRLEIGQVILSTTTLAFIKLSALFFYRRVFCTGGQLEWFDIATTSTIVVVVLWLFAFDFLIGFQCGTHFSALWDGTYLEYCTLSFPSLYGLAISDFLLDIWLMVLPIPRILKLHATLGKRLSIIGIFLLAFSGLGASIARMVEYIQTELGGPAYFLYHDEEIAVTRAIYFTSLEMGLSLIAVNLPSLWPLMVMVEPRKLLSSVRSLVSLSRSRGSGESISSGPDETSLHKQGSQWKTPTMSQLPVSAFRGDLEGQQYGASVTHEAGSISVEERKVIKSTQVEISREFR